MSDNNENTEIVRTIVMLARNLKMKVVAEGVETEQQLMQLMALGCGYAQGFFFSKPADAQTAAQMLSTSLTYPLPAAAAFAETFEPLTSVVAAEWTN